MKKIFSIMIVAALSGLLITSCSSNDYTDKVSSVQVTEVSKELSAAGGQQTFTVTGEGISARAADTWLSVSTQGNVVTVTADGNDSKQSRHTIVTVTATNGDQAVINVSQPGLVILMEANNAYLFNPADNDEAFISDMSNVEFAQTISDNWIHLTKVDSISVDDNTGGYRSGTITLSYKKFVKQIIIGQWGETLPFTSLKTAVYEDEEGNSYTKPVTVVADENDANGNTYLIKGLMEEGDLSVMLNTKTTDMAEYYLAAGYSPGKLVEDETTYTLRCLMSVYNVITGGRYYPTQVTTLETSPYRMSFEWQVDENAMPTFSYVRNGNLAANYRTDGIIVCKFSTSTGASATARKGIAYQFLNLRLSY